MVETAKGDAYAVREQSGHEKIQGAELVDAALKLQKEIYDCDPSLPCFTLKPSYISPPSDTRGMA